MHTPADVQKRSDHYPEFNTANSKVWKRIYKIPFNTIRDTKTQTFNIKFYMKLTNATIGHTL